MKIYMREKIGYPELFVGREKELKNLLEWAKGIKKEISMSRSILSRRKTGKTALLQRLYNIVFHENDGVVPFYYEVGEDSQWTVDFCKDFFSEILAPVCCFPDPQTRVSPYSKTGFPNGAANRYQGKIR